MDVDAQPAELPRVGSAPAAERLPSPIAGHGLFATVAHAGGEPVMTLERHVDDAADFGSLNHSCDPNLGWSGARDLIAARDIPAGEELTVDYSTAIDDPSFVLYCHCGSTRCRQAVEGTDWQIPQLQARYADRWAPRILQRIDEAR